MDTQEVNNNIKKYSTTKSIMLAPILSGATSLYFFRQIVFSNLTDVRYYIAISCATLLFITSSIVYVLLRRMEKEKDRYLLSTVGEIVEDVFRHYGVAMASNAAGPTTAKEMNPILQTIVNLVGGLKELAEKNYIGK